MIGSRRPTLADGPDLALDEGPSSLARDRHVAWLRVRGLEVDPYDFPSNALGVEQYLRAHGIHHFSGPEACTPVDPALWHRLYPDTPIDGLTGKPFAWPARCYWPRLVCPLVLLEEQRLFLNEPIRLGHGWRPKAYNAARQGAPRSDHLEACAWDFRVQSERARCHLVKNLAQYVALNALALSVGWHSGPRRNFHLGVLASQTRTAKRDRDWDYDQHHRSWLLEYAAHIPSTPHDASLA